LSSAKTEGVESSKGKHPRYERKYPDPRRGQEIVDHLRKASGGNHPLSTEEVMRLTGGEDWGMGRLKEGDGDPVDLGLLDSLRED
jgi:hypothetical protein